MPLPPRSCARPSGAGAPKGNHITFETGRYTTFPDSPLLNELAHAIAADPNHLPEILAQFTRQIHDRSADPLKTFKVLHHFIPGLIPAIADSILVLELEAALPRIPPPIRAASSTPSTKTPSG